MTESPSGGPTPERPQNELLNPASLAILTGRANPALAQKVARLLSGGDVEIESTPAADQFPDGEVHPKLPEVRNRSVYLIQPTSGAGAVEELTLLIDAARRASAKRITAIIPYYGYARGDKKTDGVRSSQSAARMAKIIEFTGADRIVTIDIHNEATEGAVDIPWQHLYGSHVLIPEIRKMGFDESSDFMVVSPDQGGIKRAEKFAEMMGVPFSRVANVNKRRLAPGVSEAIGIAGDVEGQDIVIVDDLIDGGGTIANAAKLLKEHGAGRIIVAATHGLFTGNAHAKIANSPIEGIIVTDTRKANRDVFVSPLIKVVSVAPLLAGAIQRLEQGQSMMDWMPHAE